MASRSSARNKIQALFSSFLHDKDDSIKESEETDSDVTTNPRVLSTMCQPRNIENFYHRVETFSPFTWFMKPLYLSPQHCALYGWENTDADLLTCVSCKATLDGILPTDWDSEIYSSTCESLKINIIDGHSKFCPWRDSPCPESFLGLPNKCASEWKEYFQSACQNLLTLESDLPVLKREAFQDMELTEDILSVLSSNIAEYDETSYHQDIVDTVCVMALCGWNTSDPNNSGVLCCNACHREAGLWNFLSLKSLSQIKNGGKDVTKDEQNREMEVGETLEDTQVTEEHQGTSVPEIEMPCDNKQGNKDTGCTSVGNHEQGDDMTTEEAVPLESQGTGEHLGSNGGCEEGTLNDSAQMVEEDTQEHMACEGDNLHSKEQSQNVSEEDNPHVPEITSSELESNTAGTEQGNESELGIEEHDKEPMTAEPTSENKQVDENEPGSPEFCLQDTEVKSGTNSPEFPLIENVPGTEEIIPFEENTPLEQQAGSMEHQTLSEQKSDTEKNIPSELESSQSQEVPTEEKTLGQEPVLCNQSISELSAGATAKENTVLEQDSQAEPESGSPETGGKRSEDNTMECASELDDGKQDKDAKNEEKMGMECLAEEDMNRNEEETESSEVEESSLDRCQESSGSLELAHYKMFAAGVFSPVHSRQDSLIVEVGDGSLDERLESLQPDLLEICGEASDSMGSQMSLPEWDDSETGEPSTKRQKTQEVEKTEFNVLTEHRNWCPWVTAVPSLNPNNTAGLIQNYPGWQILLKNLSECFSPSQKTSTDQTPPSHVWKSIRRMFYDCQTSIRSTGAGDKNVVAHKQSCN